MTVSEQKTPQELQRLREQIFLRERQLELREGLPFLHGWKWYPWAKEFYLSTNKINFLCAANQISKSSTQIRKCVDWATDHLKWPHLWPHLPEPRPKQFWYLYPSQKQARAEFQTKWKQFLPKGKYQTERVIDGKPNYYAWKAEVVNKELVAIHFPVADTYVFFKTYNQDTSTLQTGTCDAIFCDEELPIEHYEELMFRLSASEGYFHMVFTATLGQEFWRQVMEPYPHEKELLPEAHKQTVSLYDALKYEDGSLSHWSEEKIQIIKNRCSTEAEILKRVYGRFIKDPGGRKYPQFDMKRHMKPKHPVPAEWLVYAGVDIGSGGKEAHPSAICFVAIKPDFTAGRVIAGWRGDNTRTTAGDVLEQFRRMKRELNITPTAQFYDWASSDFYEMAQRMGEPFQHAEKSHEKGEEILNVLFKNDVLYVYDEPELRKLGGELSALRKDTPKNKAKDDLTDALRYAVTKASWAWDKIGVERPKAPEPEKKLTPMQQEVQERRKAFEAQDKDFNQMLEAEFAEWNAAYGSD